MGYLYNDTHIPYALIPLGYRQLSFHILIRYCPAGYVEPRHLRGCANRAARHHSEGPGELVRAAVHGHRVRNLLSFFESLPFLHSVYFGTS